MMCICFLIVNAWKHPRVYWFDTGNLPERKFFLIKDQLWNYPQSLIQRTSASITRERISQAFTMSTPKCCFIFNLHKQEPCQLANRFLLAHIMPMIKHDKPLNIFTYSNIMIWDIPSLYRYTPIYQYKGEIRPCHYPAHLKQSPTRPSSRNVFPACLPIYSKVAFFTTWAKITPSPH